MRVETKKRKKILEIFEVEVSRTFCGTHISIAPMYHQAGGTNNKEIQRDFGVLCCH